MANADRVVKYNLYTARLIPLYGGVPKAGWLNTTYAQHGLVNIAKKKRELKSFQINLFEEIFNMKSNFSRFLHHTMSSSNLTRISRWKKFANCFDLNTPIKSECDTLGKNASTGRSMVEMLGVLAIIGVLSVGAIAGYSKAMMKYKLNRHAEQMNTVINAVARNVHNFDNIKQGGTYLTPYLIKMGEIPTDMVKGSVRSVIYDVFGQAWGVFITGNGSAIYLSSGQTTALTTKSADNLEICKNILLAAKENSDSIAHVDSISNHYNNDNKYKSLYGDHECNTGVNCLKDLSLNDVYDFCTKHYGINSPSGTELAIVWGR